MLSIKAWKSCVTLNSFLTTLSVLFTPPPLSYSRNHSAPLKHSGVTLEENIFSKRGILCFHYPKFSFDTVGTLPQLMGHFLCFFQVLPDLNPLWPSQSFSLLLFILNKYEQMIKAFCGLSNAVFITSCRSLSGCYATRTSSNSLANIKVGLFCISATQRDNIQLVSQFLLLLRLPLLFAKANKIKRKCKDYFRSLHHL